MEEVWAKDFKMFVVNLPDLPTNKLGKTVINCRDLDDLENALNEYPLSTKFVACNSSELIGLDVILSNHTIDRLYVVNNENDNDIRDWLDGLILNKVTQVENRKQLMRHLCTTAVSCYYKQCLEYKDKDNNGMANLCIRDSLQALDYSAEFM